MTIKRAVAIGFFDGVHRGHQAVFQTLLDCCAANHYQPGVITFPNHPRTLLTGEVVPLLTGCDEKCRVIRRLGIEAITLLPFTPALQQLDAHAFVQTVLIEQLTVAHVVVGHDFHFGANRSGNGGTLTQLGQQLGFGVTVVPPFQLDGVTVSSRYIRQALQAGDLNTVNTLLGRPYQLSGPVVTGQKLGRQLGVPTANIQPAAECLLPANGVYAVQVNGAPGLTTRHGVANIGVRPTVSSQPTTPRLEVHLLDTVLPPDALYGHTLTVQFLNRIRPEQTFSGLDALKSQIEQDIAHTRQLLSA